MSHAGASPTAAFGQPGVWAARLAAWVEAERGRFVPWGAACVVAGVLLYFALGWEPAWWWGGAMAAALLAGAALGRQVMVLRGGLLGAGLMALGFGAGQCAAWRAAPMPLLPLRATVVSGVVREVVVLAEGRRLVLDGVRLGEETAPLGRVIRLRMKRGDETAVRAGDGVRVRAVLRRPAAPAYPGAWDQQRDAWFQGVGGGGVALDVVNVVSAAGEGGWRGRVQAVREAVAGRAMRALPGEPGAVAATLLTGTARAIPEADRAAFRDSGLAHLLAVAGLHVGAVMGLVFFAVRLGLAAWPHAALHWPTKGIAAIGALAAGAGYLLLAGAHVPLLRAFLMACLATLGVVLGRRALSLRGLALSAGAIALAWPEEVVGVSYQMSVAAVLALVTGYEAARPWLARLGGAGWRRAALHGAMLALTSLLAGAATAPFGAYHFGHVQLYFVLANMVAVPITAFWVLPLGVAAVLLMPLGLDGLAFAPMGWGIAAITWMARFVAGLPAATLAVPPMTGWGLGAFALGLAWLCLWRTRVRWAGVAAIAAGLLSPWMAAGPDVLVSDDGRLIAVRQAGGYGLQRLPGAQRFVLEAWEAHLGTFGALAGCEGGVCRVGGIAVLRAGTTAAGCEGVAVLVSAEPARGVCPGAALVDRFTVWRDGAAGVWGGEVVSDRSWRGERPWVPGPPQPGQRRTSLPTAAAE